MHNKTVNLPLFPLSIFLLPGGITRLRIFEARYLKMVSLATSNGGFIICPDIDNKSEQLAIWGSWVEIINFDQGDDGVLEIDVKCKTLVQVNQVDQNKDQLHFATAVPIKHWAENESSVAIPLLMDSLQSLVESNDLLKDLYDHNLQLNPYWVVARWIELLPIPFDIKNSFIYESTYSEAEKLVSSIIAEQL